MLVAAAAVVLASLAWSQPAEAQQTRRLLITDLPIAEQVRIRAETDAREGEAAELLRQARQAEEKGGWRTSARLYEESAGLQSEGNLFGAETYELAGQGEGGA